MSYDVTKSRVLQWIGIMAILCLFGGAYWYFQVYGSTQKTANKTGLVGYWSFDDVQEGLTRAEDFAGTNEGTLTNFIGFQDEFASSETWDETQMTGSVSGGEYVGTITNVSDPSFNKSLSFDRTNTHIEIRYKSYAGGPSSLRVYYQGTGACATWSETCTQSFSLISNGSYQVLSADITDSEWVTPGTISALRFDFDSASTTGTVYIDYIRFSSGYSADGKVGKAIDFDGTNDNVYVAQSYAAYTDNFTISFWAFPQATHEIDTESTSETRGISGQRYVIEPLYGGASNGGVGVSMGTNGISVYEHGDGYMPATLVDSSSYSGWTHVVVVYTSKQPKLYVNGALKRTGLTSPKTNVFPGPGGGSIGGGDYGYFDGLVDEVRVFNRSITTTEITNLYGLGATKLQKTQSSDLTSGLVGFWSMNGPDVSGTTAYDRSGSGNTGTLTNGPTKVPGKLGQALNLNGSNQYVSSGTNIELLSAWTVSAWVKSSDLTSTGVLVGRGGSSNIMRDYALYSQSGKFNIQRCDATTCAVVSTTTTYSNNTWYHVVGTFDGGTTGTIYINGISAGSGTLTKAVTTASRTTYIGAMMDGGSGLLYYYPGTLDEVRVYNRALSATEIQSLYTLGQSDKVNSSVSQPQGTGRLDSGLAGYWKLDENTGTSATDSSTNGNTGTLTNGPTWTTGQIGSAVIFDGTDDYVDMGTSDTLKMTGNFAISAWVNLANYTGDYRMIAYKSAGGTDKRNFFFYITQTTGTVTFGFTQGEGVFKYALSSTALTLNQWYFVTGVYDGSFVRVYVNGVLDGSAAATGAPDSQAATTTYVGRYGGPINYFSGKLDEVRIYSRALSVDEVAQLYRLTTPTGTDTSLKGYWSFNGKDMSGTTAYDRSGSGNTGTLTNGPTVAPGKLGQGLSFDGTDDYTQTSNTNFMDSYQAGTFSAWIKTTSTNAPIIAYSNGSNDNQGVCNFSVGTGGFVAWGCKCDAAGAWSIYTGDVSVNDGNWHHIVQTSDGASLSKQYIDGVEAGVSWAGGCGSNTDWIADSYAIGSLTNYINIGALRRSTAHTHGASVIDEVRVYNRALSATEITALYNASR